jgi:hypothetical protein
MRVPDVFTKGQDDIPEDEEERDEIWSPGEGMWD